MMNTTCDRILIVNLKNETKKRNFVKERETKKMPFI